MMESRRSYWESVLYNQVYDLIVVGAGLTGLSTAYFFKKENPDAEVLVLERGFFPIGASTRNAGFACIGTVGEHLADLKIESEEKVKTRIKNRFEGLLLLREILGDDFIEFEESGGWEIFPDESEFEKVKPHIPQMNTWMKDLLGVPDMYEAKPYQGIPAIFNRTEGMLHPGKMIHRLVELNTSAGVEFRWNTSVSNIDAESNRVQIGDSITLKSRRLAIASNAFTRNLLSNSAINPGRGCVLVTERMEHVDWKGTFHFNEGYVYFRNLGKHRILLGGGRNVDSEAEGTSEFGVNESIKNYLINFANEVLKLSSGWKVEYEWSGIMGFTESKTPVLEKVGENCLVVAGLSGMGVALGMQLGKSASGQLSISNDPIKNSGF